MSIKQRVNQKSSKAKERAVYKVSSVNVMLLGLFQQGKSTLGRLLIPSGRYHIGDGTTPTTQKTTGCESDCSSIKVWDTPGANSSEKHDKEWNEALTVADIAVFVKMTEKALISEEQNVLRCLADRQMPIVIVRNCKSPSVFDQDPNDPDNARSHMVCRSIEASIQNLNIPTLRRFYVNLGWAALGAGCLETENVKVNEIRRSYSENYPDDEGFREVYAKSRFEDLRQYFLTPSPFLFDGDGILSAAILGRIQKTLSLTGVFNGQR